MDRVSSRAGFTLLEMTVVIMVMLALMGTGLFVSKQWTNWQTARAASEDLRSVYAAQRMFLADNPTTEVSAIKASDLIPYLANRATKLPEIKSLEGVKLTINVNVNPPTLSVASGVVYDPSGSPSDSLWDVGEKSTTP